MVTLGGLYSSEKFVWIDNVYEVEIGGTYEFYCEINWGDSWTGFNPELTWSCTNAVVTSTGTSSVVNGSYTCEITVTGPNPTLTCKWRSL